jgi:hypothetical protein
MTSLFTRSTTHSRKHITDEDLLKLMDGEISSTDGRKVRQHLEECWGCRGRYEEMQATILQFINYRNRLAAPHMPPSSGNRNRFIAKLDESIESMRTSRASRLLDSPRLALTLIRNPLFTSCLILFTAALAITFVWRHSPTVEASELLQRAEASETHPSQNGGHLVVYQKIRIRTRNTTLERTLYRDSEGRRRSRTHELDKSETELRSTLELAGIDWQIPLAASDFRRWHDHLTDKEDEVRHTADGALTLLTRTKSSDVSEASLTVRITDFHPTGRRVVLRNSGVIEVSELDYSLLTWDEVNNLSLFEPDAGSSLEKNSPAQAVEQPAGQPTIAVLDEAELRVRLVLNQANADSGEQIVITRSASSIQITGVVETDERKQELQDDLRRIPLVHTSLQSIEELASRTNVAKPSTSRTEEHFFTAHESPLETYLDEKSATHQQAAELSRGILEAALSIERETHALDSLDKRFSSESARLSPDGRVLLKELLGRHTKSLTDAIAKEQSLIDRWAPPAPVENRMEHISDPVAELLQAASHNKELCDELLATGSESQRPANQILPEIRQLLNRLQRLALNLEEASSDSNVQNAGRPA